MVWVLAFEISLALIIGFVVLRSQAGRSRLPTRALLSSSLQQTAPDSPRQYDEWIGVVAPKKQTIIVGEPGL